MNNHNNGDDAAKFSEQTGSSGVRVVIESRHWMHVWKAGYRSCSSCRNDSRFVASIVDERDEVIEQKLYCDEHVPMHNRDTRSATDSNDPLTRLKFGLGFSIEE